MHALTASKPAATGEHRTGPGRTMATRLLDALRRRLARQRVYGETFRSLDGLNDRMLMDLGIRRVDIAALADQAAMHPERDPRVSLRER